MKDTTNHIGNLNKAFSDKTFTIEFSGGELALIYLLVKESIEIYEEPYEIETDLYEFITGILPKEETN